MLGNSPAYSGFSVDDLASSATFYTDVLGLQVHDRDDALGVMTLRLGGGADVLLYSSSQRHAGGFTVLNFPVTDVAAAVDELASRGVRTLRYEGLTQDERGIHTGGGPLIAWFADPSGNVLSVIQDGWAAPR